MHRQHASFGGKSKWTDDFDVCATLFYGLIKDHPFHDANKRTAFLCALYHLDKIGRTPTCPQKEMEDLAVDLADNRLGKYARYQDLSQNCRDDAEVRFVSWFLRKNTREQDRRSYIVTYRQLQNILKRYDCALENADRNFIDVIRYTKESRFLGFGTKTVRERLCMIGFPGWTKQVPRSDIKRVRQSARLDVEHGIDSKVFFQNADALPVLMDSVSGALMRLAVR